MEREDQRPIVFKQRAGNYMPDKPRRKQLNWLPTTVICIWLLVFLVWFVVLNHPNLKP